jgi:hypothetical protein
MKRTLLILTIVLATFTGAYSQHSHHGSGDNKDVTIIGEVIDPVCYLAHNAKGSEHKQCAEQCVKQGMSLGILEDNTGKVYVSLPVDHTNPNAKLKDFVAEKVKVTGKLYSKGGLTGLHVKTVERAK